MTRKLPYDQGLLAIVLFLLGFGLIMVYSASTIISGQLYGSPTWIFTRQLVLVLAGLGVLMGAMKVDYHFYQRPLVVYTLLGITLALLVGLLFTEPTGGVRRWIRMGPLNLQPSELAKLAVIVFSASYLVARRDRLGSLLKGLLPHLAVVGTAVLLVLAGPDLGTAVSIALTAGLLLFLAGLPIRYLVGLMLLALPAVYFLVIQIPYRLNRVLAYWDPGRDPYGIGYQTRQSLIAVGSGGWSGVGYAQGKQKLFFLPEPHTDFIYAVVGEEFGLVGCLALLLLFCLFFWRGARIALRADSAFGTYLGLGIVSMIFLQALVNMSMVISLLPTKGLPLPFVSVGGSSMIVTLMSVGILLNISHHGRGGPSGQP